MTDDSKPRSRGGARPGAGRKPRPPTYSDKRDPLDFLLDVMQGVIDANATQVRAAIAAAQYLHTRTKDGGKKERAQRRAGEVAADPGWAALLEPTTPPRGRQ